MVKSATVNGAAAGEGLTTSQSDYIEWLLEKDEWWVL